MNETKRISMSDAMTAQMAKTLQGNVDEIAAVLGINVGTGPNDEKLSRLMSGVVMDCITGRMLPDPGRELDSIIKDQESIGRPMCLEEQDLRADWAIQVMPYWSGKREQPTRTVLWNMLLTGRFPHKPSMADVDGILDFERQFNPLGLDVLLEQYQALNRNWAALSETVKDFCGEPSAKAFSAYMQSAAESDAALAAEHVSPVLTLFQDSLKAYKDAATRELRAEICRRYGYDGGMFVSACVPPAVKRPEYVDADDVASALRKFENRTAFGRRMANVVRAYMNEPALPDSAEAE